MRVNVSVEETTLVNDDGREINGVTATCERCDHETESYGTGEGSIRRCLALLREECPREEENFYVVGDVS